MCLMDGFFFSFHPKFGLIPRVLELSVMMELDYSFLLRMGGAVLRCGLRIRYLFV